MKIKSLANFKQNWTLIVKIYSMNPISHKKRFRSAPRSYRVHIAVLRYKGHLTTKPETIVRQIEDLHAIYSRPVLRFKD